MKILFKNAIFLVSSVLILNISPLDARANNNYLTVTFKPGTNEKYIKIVNLLTNSSINKRLDANTYNINVNDDNNSQNLLYTIPEVLLINKDNNSLSTGNPVFINKNKPEIKKSGDIVEGQIIVRFKNNVSKAEIQKLDDKLKTKSKLISSALNLYITTLPSSLKSSQAVELFKQTKMVEYAETDRIMKIQKNGFSIKSVKNKKQVEIRFKKSTEGLAEGLFSIIYENNLIRQNNIYLLNIDDNIDAKYLIKALKSSPYIADAKLFLGNK